MIKGIDGDWFAIFNKPLKHAPADALSAGGNP